MIYADDGVIDTSDVKDVAKYINNLYKSVECSTKCKNYVFRPHRCLKAYNNDAALDLNIAAAQYYHFYNIWESYVGFDEIVSISRFALVGGDNYSSSAKCLNIVVMFLTHVQSRRDKIDTLRKITQRFLNKQTDENLEFVFNKIKKFMNESKTGDICSLYGIATLHNTKRMVRHLFCEDITCTIMKFLM